jgi:hypothetical protein
MGPFLPWLSIEHDLLAIRVVIKSLEVEELMMLSSIAEKQSRSSLLLEHQS